MSSVQSERERKVDSKMLRRKQSDGDVRKADIWTLDYFPLLTVLSGFHGNNPSRPDSGNPAGLGAVSVRASGVDTCCRCDTAAGGSVSRAGRRERKKRFGLCLAFKLSAVTDTLHPTSWGKKRQEEKAGH